eukprot:10562930-Alexandrium_andersonii.AAC.1
MDPGAVRHEGAPGQVGAQVRLRQWPATNRLCSAGGAVGAGAEPASHHLTAPARCGSVLPAGGGDRLKRVQRPPVPGVQGHAAAMWPLHR